MKQDDKATGTGKSFDPTVGCQTIWTGVLGGFNIILLAAAYSVYSKKIMASGGPKIYDCLAWMPKGLSFNFINRNYFDILFIVAIGFTIMAAWEFLKAPAQRAAALVIALSGIVASWAVAFGAQPFFTSPTVHFMGWQWTNMETVWAVTGSAMSLLLIWRIREFRPGDHNLPPPRWALKTAFFRWISGLVFFSAVLSIFLAHPFYGNGYYENWRITVSYLFTIYALFGLPYGFITNLLRKSVSEDRKDAGFVLTLIFHSAIRASFKRKIGPLRRALYNKRNLCALRDLGVKFFFVPLMLTFLFTEISGFFRSFPSLLDQSLFIAGNMTNSLASLADPLKPGPWNPLFDFFYGSVFHGIFVMDVSLSLVGYICSSRWLDNKSRSVEPTLSGWFVALMCYPPFNGISTNYMPYDRHFPGSQYLDFTHYGLFDPSTAVALTNFTDFTLKIATLAAFTIYVWATMAFGLRFSNLTNRGIIAQGPYAYIRHPAYISKNFAWWTENIRNFSSPWQIVFLAGWNIVYFLRALTEERHLKKDPDYLAYCEKVKYRFIPGWW